MAIVLKTSLFCTLKADDIPSAAGKGAQEMERGREKRRKGGRGRGGGGTTPSSCDSVSRSNPGCPEVLGDWFSRFQPEPAMLLKLAAEGVDQLTILADTCVTTLQVVIHSGLVLRSA